MSYLSLAQTTPPPELPPDPPPALTSGFLPPINEGPDPAREFIVNVDAAEKLGKALFWDQNVGSDGMACASCHFHAGADNRVKNQINPNTTNAESALQTIFDPTGSGGVRSGANYTVRPADYPFHRPLDINVRNPRTATFDTNDVTSSAGTFSGDFNPDGDLTQDLDQCSPRAADAFSVPQDTGALVRRVEPRNTPTTINAAFNFRNFWDGRANNIFNGMDPFGNRNASARILVTNASGVPRPIRIAIRNSSAASQAVGPVLSAFESSCDRRTFAHVARKLLSRRALATQTVDPTDSELGPLSSGVTIGINRTYTQLIQAAFAPRLWSGQGAVNTTGLTPLPPGQAYPVGMTQIEYNFPLFFGLAVQAYERTLISNQSPYDQWARTSFSRSTTVLSASQLRGFDIFMNLGQTAGVPQGRCIACHKGPEFTSAASFLQRQNPIERMLMEGNIGLALYDTGFYNIGVVPTPNDLGLGGRDPFGNELSFTKQFTTATPSGFRVNVDDLAIGPVGNPNVNPIFIDPCGFDYPFSPVDPVSGECDRTILTDAQFPVLAQHEVAVNGAFKTPTLRNAELTGPYMHNGGMKSLREVVDFYNRGGNFANFGLDADIEPIGMTTAQKIDLVNFLRALTDPRVRQEQGPFDHPSLRVFQGHPGNQNVITQTQIVTVTNPDGTTTQRVVAADSSTVLPAVGSGGRPAKGLPQLGTFLNQ